MCSLRTSDRPVLVLRHATPLSGGAPREARGQAHNTPEKEQPSISYSVTQQLSVCISGGSTRAEGWRPRRARTTGQQLGNKCNAERSQYKYQPFVKIKHLKQIKWSWRPRGGAESLIAGAAMWSLQPQRPQSPPSTLNPRPSGPTSRRKFPGKHDSSLHVKAAAWTTLIPSPSHYFLKRNNIK